MRAGRGEDEVGGWVAGVTGVGWDVGSDGLGDMPSRGSFTWWM